MGVLQRLGLEQVGQLDKVFVPLIPWCTDLPSISWGGGGAYHWPRRSSTSLQCEVNSWGRKDLLLSLGLINLKDNHYWKILTSEVKNNIKTRDTVWKSILVTCAGLGQFQLPAENSIATAADCSNHCPLSTVLELPSLICNDHDCFIIYFSE